MQRGIDQLYEPINILQLLVDIPQLLRQGQVALVQLEEVDKLHYFLTSIQLTQKSSRLHLLHILLL